MPNVGLEDESPSSKSEGTPEEEPGHADSSNNAQGDESPGHADDTDAQKSPLHQTFANGERRRRKLPEIPKTRKCK